MGRLQAIRHLEQRAQLARQYTDQIRRRAAECRDLYAARVKAPAAPELPRVRVTPQPEAWRATLRRLRWCGLPDMVITTGNNPSQGEALADLRAMVATYTGSPFCVARGDIITTIRKTGDAA